MTKALIGPAVRNILTLVFGFALGQGLVTESELQTIAAGIAALINLLVILYVRGKAP